MNIRPKNEILFALTGVKFSLNNLGGANWRQQVFNNYRLHLLDLLTKYGEADDYGLWLNEMLSRHSQIYNLAGGKNGNWQNVAYKNDLVGKYQHDYRGSLRFGKIKINDADKYDFNLSGIKTNQSTRYNIINPPTRTSGDYSRTGYNYNPDNLYSAITDDRRLLGRKGDWDENSNEYKLWQKDLNSKGWETYLDSDNYYKLRRLLHPETAPNLSNTLQSTNQQQTDGLKTSVTANHRDRYGFDWGKIAAVGLKIFGNPDIYAYGRLAGNLINNERVYGEALKGISPVLRQTYNTHRQIVGDEATKQAYYRRAVKGLTKAALPFTSDADRLVAYMMEAKRVGDELRALGDLADNQEIRRTSDESNQHQWANTLRATEVANANIASINQANSLKHNLLAQKHSAQWSSIDNFLLGVEYRKRQKLAEQQALDDLIFALQEQLELLNDPEYLDAYKKLQNVVNKHTDSSGNIDDINHPEILEAKRKVQQAQINVAIRSYQRKKQYYQNRGTIGSIFYAKSGTKVTHKKKDDLLYKSTKDVVDHFRKMSKMSSDALNRKTPKIEKLTSHPKGRTRRYLLGGLAPFTIYKPVALGGETTTSTETGISSTTSKSSKDTATKDKLDMIKEMFKAVLTNGLPIDVNVVYRDLNNLFQKAKLFGEDLSSDDIATIYLQSMLKISNLKYSKENYDKALALATSNESLNEIAVDVSGNYIVSDEEGNLSKVGSLSEAREKQLTPVTNQQLLNLRAYSPDMAFRKGDSIVTNVINNGMGINKIGAQIKALAGNLGNTEGKLEGISQVESGKVKAGLQILSGTQGTPDGHYSVTDYTKDLKVLVLAALNYISNMLSPAQKATLQAHGGVKENIMLFLGSQQDYTRELTISPLTGKAAKEGKEDDLDKLGINSATLLLLGMSSPREFTFNIGNGNSFTGAARVSSITKDGNPFGADFTYSEIYKSDLHKNLDLDNASFGDVPINKSLKDRIVIDNSTIAGVDLPYTIDRNGRIIPDFLMLNRIEEADLEILRSGIDPNKDPQKVNEIYAKHKLPIKYGANNKLTGNYKRFAVVLATAIEDVFLNKDGLASNGTLTLVSDENEINKYLNELKKATGEKEIDMDRPGLFTGNKDIYKGSIFIPIIGDLVDAVSATGGLKVGNYDELRSKYLTRNYNEAPLFVKQ